MLTFILLATEYVTTNLMFIGQDNQQDCAYKGLGVSFEGHSEIDWLWRCKVSFSPLNRKGQPFSPSAVDYAGCFRSRVEMVYEFNPSYEKEARDKQNAIFADNKKEKTIETTNFTFQHRGDSCKTKAIMERLFKGTFTLMSWQTKVNSLYDALEAVQKMKDTEGNFPIYNLAGYDFTYPTLNCCGFSVKLLNSLGVGIDDCLSRYLCATYDKRFSGWFKTYNPIALINHLFGKESYMKALSPEATIVHLLQANFSDNLPAGICEFNIYPGNILELYPDKIDQETKGKLDRKKRCLGDSGKTKTSWEA